MSDKNIRKISVREGKWLFVVLFASRIFFSDIGGYISHSGTAAYMQTAVTALTALLIFAFTLYLSGKNTDIFSAAESVSGDAGVKVIGVLFSILFLLDSGVMLRVYADIISSIVLPQKSDFFIMIFLAAAVLVSTFAGLVTLGAYSYVAGIVMVFSLAAILILNIPNYDVLNIYPVFGKGADKIFLSYRNIGTYADVVLLFLISPYFSKYSTVKKTGMSAILISGVIITITTLLYIMTVEMPLSEQMTLPVLEIAFDVNLDVIFQRAEGLFFFLWIFSGFIVTSVYVNASIHSFVRGFDVTDRRAVGGIFTLLAVCIALGGGASSHNEKYYTMFYDFFSAVAFIVPIVVFGLKRVLKRTSK